MTFKKAEMAKTLRNGLSMIETNPLNHIWSDLVILLGLSLNRFQKKLLLRDLTFSLDMHWATVSNQSRSMVSKNSVKISNMHVYIDI